MKTTDLKFLSYDGQTTIRGWLFEPNRVASKKEIPRAVIQIVHGSSEHSGRYVQLAKYLVEQGFVVCSHDHIGHGLSIETPDDLGYIPAEGGTKILIEDTHQLHLLIQQRYLDSVPYILLGHSLGSYIIRVYISVYGDYLDAAVVSGTTNPYIFTIIPSLMLLERNVRKQGDRMVSPGLYYSYGQGRNAFKMKERRTDFDWLCSDPAVVDAYMADPLCGFMYSNGAYLTMATLIRNMISEEARGYTPSHISIFGVAGEHDPVSSNGRAVVAMVKSFSKAKKGNLEVTIIPEAYHDVFLEPSWKKTVNTVITWLELRVGA
ncbi:MAG: lysophospholipase [Coriobacteriia bacterium]|nr:lysophospholipase [Coriobacteriia bacterium]